MPRPRNPAALRRRHLLATLAGLAPPVAAVRRALAQAVAASPPWPERRVRLVVPAAPGSSLDLVGRVVAERLGARWGQPVLVEARPGAEGIPALEAMLAAPAGEALFLANHGVVTVTPLLRPSLGFDPMAELVPIIELTTDPFGVVVPAVLPAQDLAGLLALARAQPGALNYTSPAGPPYLAMRAFLREAGTDMTFVGFRGVGSAALAELVAGRLQAAMVPLATAMGMVTEDKLRLIAVTGAARAPLAPAVPTAAEQGYPRFRQEGVHGLFGWKGMPAALRTRLAAEAAAVMAEPGTTERLRGAGLEIRQGGTPDGFAALLVEQRQRWSGLVQAFGAEAP